LRSQPAHKSRFDLLSSIYLFPRLFYFAGRGFHAAPLRPGMETRL